MNSGVIFVVKLQSNYKIINRECPTLKSDLSKEVGAPIRPFSSSTDQPSDNISFSGLKRPPLNKAKAILLSLMTLFSTPNMLKSDDVLGKTFEEVGAKTALIKSLEGDFSLMLEKLSNEVPVKKSFYYDSDIDGINPSVKVINSRRLDDYNKLLESYPDLDSKNSVISILKTCGEYGAMYIRNIPDSENILKHAQGLNRLAIASEKIQGCKFQNAAIFNGFSADELMKKVVIPNEKIANGEVIGKGENTLIMITPEFGSDGNTYVSTFNNKPFLSKNGQISNKIFNFTESFLGHYDNILVIQPNGKNADDVLNTAFANVEKGLYKGAKTDMMYLGHDINGFNGTMLSDWYPSIKRDSGIYMMDIGDFEPVSKGGKTFAVSIANIFKNAINNGYNPSIIGNGCNSEKLLQGAVNKLLPESIQDKVHVFGTPYYANDPPIMGFSSDNRLSYVKKVDPFFDNNTKGLLIRITDSGNKTQPDWQKTDSFVLDEKLKAKIINDYRSGIGSGVLVKSNGMIMEYRVLTYVSSN